MSSMKPQLLRSAAFACLFAATACSGGGGGGGVGNTPTPPPVSPAPSPTPAPVPTAPPPPPTFDTTEYRATVGAVSANALAAYNVAATGAGITVGVIDSGIDLQSAEFGNRINPNSASTAGNGTVDDEDGHGTAVSFTIAGRRNGAGTHGIAFDASLIVARADTPGSCADTTGDGCSFNDNAIAQGLDLARNNGARVVNISLGGDAPNSAVIDAINRATAAGIIIVISAGNEFVDHPATAINPDPFAQVANLSQARNLVIIAGSVGANDARTPGGDAISTFSNRAVNSFAHYLAGVGEQVRAPDENDTAFLWSGTSFSAPQIAGAAALLAQAFPNLTGAQIVEILYQSARDAGTAGDDAVYGQGVLDLTKAFSPLGTSSVAGTTSVVSLNVNATLSAPMGDARQGELGAVILDGFSRAFAIDLARTIDRSGPARTWGGVLQSQQRNVSAGLNGDMTVALTVAPVRNGAGVLPMTLNGGDARSARAIAGIVTKRMGSDAAFAFGFAEGGATLTAQLAGRAEPAFLVARDPVRGQGFDSSVKGSSAIRQQFGAVGLTAAVESGNVLTRDADLMPALQNRYMRYGYDRASVAIDRQFGGLNVGLTGTRLAEYDTVLGARFGNALGGTRGTSWFLDAAARWDMGAGWTLGGSLRQGWTLADVRGGLTGRGLIRTNAFAGDIGKNGVFGRFDSFGLRIAQPLRVARGGIDLKLPTNYDYDTLSVTQWTTQRLNLAPTGREIDMEARYALPILGGAFQTNLFWRRDPGNFAALSDDVGGAVRWSVTF